MSPPRPRAAVLLTLLLSACKPRPSPIEPDAPPPSPEGRRKDAPVAPPSPGDPSTAPLASLSPSGPEPEQKASPGCFKAEAPATLARLAVGDKVPYVKGRPDDYSADARGPWLTLARRRREGDGSTKLCYLKPAADCLSATQIADSFYSDACCEKLSLSPVRRGPTVEVIIAPSACAGVTVCCYEGEGAVGSGPGRLLRVGKELRVAALRAHPAWGLGGGAVAVSAPSGL